MVYSILYVSVGSLFICLPQRWLVLIFKIIEHMFQELWVFFSCSTPYGQNEMWIVCPQNIIFDSVFKSGTFCHEDLEVMRTKFGVNLTNEVVWGDFSENSKWKSFVETWNKYIIKLIWHLKKKQKKNWKSVKHLLKKKSFSLNCFCF